MSIKILLDKCTGCTLCVKACPFSAIKMENKKAVIDLDACTLCGACVPACKFDAIELKKELGGADRDLSHYRGVWVFAEQREGKIQPVAYELLTEGKKLAESLKTELAAALCGDAAGLVKPWSGGGVIWGLTAAGLLLKNFPDFIKYQKEAKRVFYGKFVFSRLATRLVYFLGFRIPWILPANFSIEGDFLKL